jgi:DNA-binding transcriptional MerR regulator/quercetin dioxygenase-like cupin family protein
MKGDRRGQRDPRKEMVMAYTVKQVAAMSGVSVRTLHFYDETGLLRPAYTGANGYRFYEEPQLLTLQQILFYRELKFELKQIKEILGRNDFEKISALESHRLVLQEKLAQTHSLIETIDKTVEHLKGTKKMKTDEMFVGFSVGAGDDRFGEHIKLGGPEGEPIDCKVSAQDTGGAMCVFEFNCNSGGPKHLHRDQDEWIYVVDGEFEFHVAERQFRAGPGESVFIPRTVAHVWGRVGESPGRIINVYQPAGEMEEFFREVGKYDGKPAIHEALGLDGLRKLFDAYGMSLTGPPLGWQGGLSVAEVKSR